MAQVPNIDTALLLRAASSPSIGQAIQSGTAGLKSGIDIGNTLAAQKLARKKQEDDLMAQIAAITNAQATEARLKKQSEAGFVTPEELKSKTPASAEMTVEKARLFAPEKPKEQRTLPLQAKGRTSAGQIISFDPAKGIDVVGTEIYDPKKHGEAQPLVSPELGGDMLKDIGNIRNSIAQLSEVESLFSKTDGQAAGPVQARIQDFTIKTGISIPFLRELSAITDDKVKFRTASQSAINDYIKAITGAQMSEPEARRIMKALPDRKSADEAFVPALQEILKLSRSKLKNTLDTYKAAGYRNIDRIAGLDEQTNTTQDSDPLGIR